MLTYITKFAKNPLTDFYPLELVYKEDYFWIKNEFLYYYD